MASARPPLTRAQPFRPSATQILLNNVSNGIEFEDLQLDTSPILSDLHLHSAGNQLIVATPYKVSAVAPRYVACVSTRAARPVSAKVRGQSGSDCVALMAVGQNGA